MLENKISTQPLGPPENTIDRWKALGLISDDEVEFPKPICCYVKTIPNPDYVEPKDNIIGVYHDDHIHAQ